MTENMLSDALLSKGVQKFAAAPQASGGRCAGSHRCAVGFTLHLHLVPLTLLSRLMEFLFTFPLSLREIPTLGLDQGLYKQKNQI